jgi:hypothetical protein
MTESDESKPRPRWFQFDLRLLFVLIAAIGVILALEVPKGSGKSKRKLAEILQVGESVGTLEHTEGVTISVNGPSHYSPGTVTEIGEDFIAFRRDSDNSEVFVPWSRIYSVRRYVPGTAAITKTPVKTPWSPPAKTLLKTSDLVNRKTSDPLIRKTTEVSP